MVLIDTNLMDVYSHRVGLRLEMRGSFVHNHFNVRLPISDVRADMNVTSKHHSNDPIFAAFSRL